MSLTNRIRLYRGLLIAVIAIPIIATAYVFNNPSPEATTTGAVLGILIRVYIGSGIAFGVLMRLMKKAESEKALKEEIGLPDKTEIVTFGEDDIKEMQRMLSKSPQGKGK